ncbi:hypothetical protein NDU88_010316 [Pleurodeles waltl]|uniref:Uncharacterized protein n=1 Tax=Pleurodeles waltl TaxID=8319 RepID=A0AAV7RXW3_PLEWA|nr:hypothetical protein NDU88_010316 [Pleurodeles waltl]
MSAANQKRLSAQLLTATRRRETSERNQKRAAVASECGSGDRASAAADIRLYRSGQGVSGGRGRLIHTHGPDMAGRPLRHSVSRRGRTALLVRSVTCTRLQPVWQQPPLSGLRCHVALEERGYYLTY